MGSVGVPEEGNAEKVMSCFEARFLRLLTFGGRWERGGVEAMAGLGCRGTL